MSVIVKTAVRKGEALIAQILSSGDYSVFTATSITVTLPDLSVLTILPAFFLKAANYLQIDQIGTLPAIYNTNLLGDLQKWGFDTDATDKFLHITLEDLQNPANAAYFTYVASTGAAQALSLKKFPDGVYKFVGVGTANPGGDVNHTSRFLSTAESDEYLSTSVNSYLALQVDETAYQQDIDALKDLVMKLLIIQYGTRYDFNHGFYANAGIKAAALKTIIDTGVYIFKPGH